MTGYPLEYERTLNLLRLLRTLGARHAKRTLLGPRGRERLLRIRTRPVYCFLSEARKSLRKGHLRGEAILGIKQGYELTRMAPPTRPGARHTERTLLGARGRKRLLRIRARHPHQPARPRVGLQVPLETARHPILKVTFQRFAVPLEPF